MEEQDHKKTREIHFETQDDDNRSQPNHIPLDLTMEIVLRLPAKSILRYRCVSKLWSSFTTLPSFIHSFATRSRPPRLLITFQFEDKQLVVSFPQNQNPDGSYSRVYSYYMTGINSFLYPQSQSVQGLVFSSGLQIWNPSLGQVFTLPSPKEHISILLYSYKTYLGYVPLEGKHKVLCLFYGIDSVQPLILTLGAKESWRIVTKGQRCPVHTPIGEYGRCFNGVLYYQAKVDGQNIIMSFDFKYESFSPINYPEYSYFRWWWHNMIPYEGRIAFVADNLYDYNLSDVELYILKDANGHEWTHQHFPHVPCKSEWRIYMIFCGITDAGELVFAPTSFVNSFYFLYFDPKRNSTREAFFERLVSDELGRSHGDPNYRTCIKVFPNHMDSLVSL